MGNPFQGLGYAMLAVAGLCIAVSLLSPGFRPDNTSVWLSGVTAVMIWMYGYRALREDDLGTVSAQWLHEYRCETHQNG